jgi:hypothetical protein
MVHYDCRHGIASEEIETEVKKKGAVHAARESHEDLPQFLDDLF